MSVSAEQTSPDNSTRISAREGTGERSDSGFAGDRRMDSDTTRPSTWQSEPLTVDDTAGERTRTTATTSAGPSRAWTCAASCQRTLSAVTAAAADSSPATAITATASPSEARNGRIRPCAASDGTTRATGSSITASAPITYPVTDIGSSSIKVSHCHHW